jgi:4-hydroxy-2-oxoglutarate aldolase
MAAIKLAGILPSLATPFDYSGAIYAAKVRHNVGKWNEVKLTGYVVAACAGEGASLDREEKVELWSLVAESAASGRVLVAAAGSESVRETVSLVAKAAAIGYHAALVRAPSVYLSSTGTAEAQESYFGAVADQSSLPVILDSCPLSTGVAIGVESIAKLSRHPNIIAVNEGSGSVAAILYLLRQVKTGFHVLTGSAGILWPALSCGASGAILGYAAAAPYSCVTIWEAHRTREQEAALDWQNRIGGPAELVTAKFGVAGLKHAMDLNGYYGGPCRLPLLPITREAKHEIAAAFENLRS